MNAIKPAGNLSRKELLGPVCIAGVLILGGLFVAASGVREAIAVHRTGPWPSVEGVVTESYMAETSDTDGKHYEWVFRYAYTVNGRDYVGSRRFAGDRGAGGTRSARERNQRDHPPGMKVTVHYNPAAPGDCVLRTDDYDQAIWGMAMGLGMALFCGLGLAVFLRGSSKYFSRHKAKAE